MATLIIQITGMPAGIPSISADQLALKGAVYSVGVKHSKKVTCSPFDDYLHMLPRKRMEVINNLNTPKYKVLTLSVCSAQNEREDCYFKINGTPVRIAWLERVEKGQYKAALIVDERLTSRGCPESPGLHIEGPYNIPPSPCITKWPWDMDIITMDSGILEAYSCLRWRSIAAGMNYQTHIIWFSQDINLFHIFVEHFRAMMRSMTVIWYGLPMRKQTLKALRRRNKQLMLIKTTDPWKNILPAYTPSNRGQYVIGEKLRAYVSQSRPSRKLSDTPTTPTEDLTLASSYGDPSQHGSSSDSNAIANRGNEFVTYFKTSFASRESPKSSVSLFTT
ncbi:hypothetical protein GGI35DRAFT_491572 [Trichoderma velutinum]